MESSTGNPPRQRDPRAPPRAPLEAPQRSEGGGNAAHGRPGRGLGPRFAVLAAALIAAAAPGACGWAPGGASARSAGDLGRAGACQRAGGDSCGCRAARTCSEEAGGAGGAEWVGAGGGLRVCSAALRLRGGVAGPPKGSARALWDVHTFASEDGFLSMFRHKDLGTAVEIRGKSPGDFAFMEREGGNVSTCAEHGELLASMSPTGRNFLVNGSNILDPDDGFVAADMLYELSKQEGLRPMVAEWMDCGNWEAWDDGTKPYIRILNHLSNATLALTKDGFIFVGADAGPIQPRKPWGLVLKEGGKAEKVTQAEARRLLAAL